MAITVEQFRTKFPEFSGATDDQIELCIEEAELQIDETTWGAWYDFGLYYLTAHLLAPSSGSDGSSPIAAGPLVGKSVGDVSWQYGSTAAGSGSSSDYQSTTYGQRYEEIASRFGYHVVVA